MQVRQELIARKGGVFLLFVFTVLAMVTAQTLMLSLNRMANPAALDNAITQLGLSKLAPSWQVPIIVSINSAVQTIIIGLMVVIGARASSSLELRSLIVHKTKNIGRYVSAFPIYMVIGIAIGVLTIALDFLFLNLMPELEALQKSASANSALFAIDTPVASFLIRFLWGGVYEEVIFRWGVMSIIALLVFKLLRHRKFALSAGILLAALLFGVGHLPAVAAAEIELNTAIIIRTLVLNALFGIAAGIAFTRNSLEAAMTLHASGHIALLGIPVLFATMT